MKRWIVVLLGLSALASGCVRFKNQSADSPPAVETALVSATPAQQAPAEATADVQSDPLPDFTSMTFVEKNNLYMQLLTERQSAGMDTSLAEETYLYSMEASFAGESAQADKALEEAILLLWNQ